MLYNAKTLKGYKLHSQDGEIGEVSDFYFDDQNWTVRYLVANTGNWLKERKVLISPHALGDVLKEEGQITVNLTRQQIENSPILNNDRAVSQEFEQNYHAYYGYPVYWGGTYMWGSYPDAELDSEELKDDTKQEKTEDSHLRSTNHVRGYYLQATDGEIGHVDDFLIDDDQWALRYLVIDSQNWWPGKKVLLSPQWIKRVSWEELSVFVNIPREAIKQSPEYTEESLLTRDYEKELHRHYSREGYWVNDSPDKEK